LITDSGRILGNACSFLERATPAQLEFLPGVSIDMLRVAAWAAFEGDRLYKERQSQVSKKTGDLGVLMDTAAALRSKVLARREVLYETLRTLVGEDATWLSRISNAYGYCSTPDELTKAVTDLVAVGRSVLAETSPGMVSRKERHNLTEDWLERAEYVTASYKRAAEAASGPKSAAVVAQADVDWWDGANLWMLEKIINLFDAGNQADPTIPRLVPISLYSWFTTSKQRKAQGGVDPGTGGETVDKKPA
jgi:hypothetical protein